jgi:hypothetical protein
LTQIEDFLPETTSINNNQNGQAGIIFGDFYYYGDKNDTILKLEYTISSKYQEIEHQKKEIKLLREMLEVLKEKNK